MDDWSRAATFATLKQTSQKLIEIREKIKNDLKINEIAEHFLSQLQQVLYYIIYDNYFNLFVMDLFIKFYTRLTF